MKKQSQLGINPSTASHRLVKDLLFNYIKETPCFHCGKPLTRETFSIEHKVPWLDSEDPVGLYFDLNNIDFSHQACNASAARRPTRIYESTTERETARSRRRYTPEKRRARYLRTGH